MNITHLCLKANITCTLDSKQSIPLLKTCDKEADVSKGLKFHLRNHSTHNVLFCTVKPGIHANLF